MKPTSRGFLAVFIAVGVGVGIAVTGVAFVFYNSSTKECRDCVAILWDRKHPDAVKQREEEAYLRECEADRLRYGIDCDCRVPPGQPRGCITDSS